MSHILCAGFICGDIVLSPVDSLPPAGGNQFVHSAALALGGCAANTAVGLARLLGNGPHRVAAAGRTGADPLGRLIRDALAEAGVDASPLLDTPNAATASITVLVSATGERSFYVYPGACERFAPEDLPDSLLRGFDHLHLAAIGSLAQLAGAAAADVAARARRLGLSVSLDVSLNPPRDFAADVLPLLPHVTLFLPNFTEAQAALGQGSPDELLGRGLACGVPLMGIKLGAAGCVLARAGEQVAAPAFAISPVDTVGAGDAWAAAVVYGWLQGWPLAEIASFANAAGALAALQPSATAGMQDAASILRWRAQWLQK